ncbi:hypothetical protein ABB37_02383 [Leptomonas pyrrhocoris]|uniref:Uncharacterized protein n=1 Tax=Leptomonas pyrrhocoris TaxID=157538 RepID=A0A0N0VGU5_LEPPY|nr:hypothetical protein ABB37_02383 [Leptomonas pyrrhocoris]KPA84401.1 hypothetical protein ABB37_02383 [Leptomonas pyrrhocoris]|eukprot:XP_015662840.1 hypothetical protein ABB37_02383 [Leptomonas pyrrhocoris]
MSKSLQSDSTLSTGSGLSGRYELTFSPLTSGKQVGPLEQAKATEFDDDDTYGLADYNARPFISHPANRTGPMPPVPCGLGAKQTASPLVGYAPLQPDRRFAANSGSGNGATNASSLLAMYNRAVTSAGSPCLGVDGKSDRHRSFAQALRTPLIDTDNNRNRHSTNACTGSNSSSRSSNKSPLAASQSARSKARRGPTTPTTRLAEPATTNIATSARRVSGGCLEPLSRSTGGAFGVVATSSRERRTRTPTNSQEALLAQSNGVTSAPTYLFGASSKNSTVSSSSRGVAVRASFLGEPPPRSEEETDNAGLEGTGGPAGQGTAAFATPVAVVPTAPLHRDEFHSPDTTLLRRGVVTSPAEARPSRQVIALPKAATGTDSGDVPTGSPTPTIPRSRRINASRSGSSVFSMHTLVSRRKNANCFDYGLSALGFPVEGSRQPPPPQHQPKTPQLRGISPGGPGANYNGAESSFAAASHLCGIGHAGDDNGSGLVRMASSPNDVTMTTATTNSTLPSLVLHSRQSSPQTHQQSIAGVTGVISMSSHSSASLTGHSARETPLGTLARWASGGGGSADSAFAVENIVDALKQQQQHQHQQESRTPVGSNLSTTARAATTATTAVIDSVPAAPHLRVGRRKTADAARDDQPAEVKVNATSADTLPNRNSSSNGSGATPSVSLRSIVLQPRHLPRTSDDVDDNLRGDNSSDFFVMHNIACGDGAKSGRHCSTVVTVGARLDQPPQPSPSAGTPNVRNPKLPYQHAGPRSPCLDEVADEADRDALLQASLVHHDDSDDDEALLYGDFDESYNDRSGESAEDGMERGAACVQEHGKGNAAQASRPPLYRNGKPADAARASDTSPANSNVSSERNSANIRCSLNPVRGTTAEERQWLARASCETFLPFDEVAAVGSRGFNSLLLTSFLRQARSSETAHPSASFGSSPPSSMAATVAGLPYGSLCASVASQTSGSAPVAAAAGDGSRTAPADEVQLLNTRAEQDGASAAITTAAAASSPRGTHGNLASSGSALRVPALPRLSASTSLSSSPRPQVSGSRDRLLPSVDNGSSTTAAAEAALPLALTHAGILRWAKPLSAAELSGVDGSPAAFGASSFASASPPKGIGERLLHQLDLLNHGAWQDAQVLCLLEHRSPAPTSATRVFAADNGYAIRVVQNGLMGDCETDECVERCAAAVMPGAMGTDGAALPCSLALPSALIDNAVQRFFEEGENAVAVVIDTADDFAARRTASTTKVHRDRSDGGDDGVSPQMDAWVAQAMGRQVVEAFEAFKDAQSKTQPNLVTDLKVAVAFIPVLPNTPNTSSDAPFSPSSRQNVKPVFYDAVSEASSPRDVRRPLKVAKSPIFGTCLNECQWVVVEDESDITVVFTLLRRIFPQVQGRQGFLYIQFLHQCFVPGTAAGGGAASSTGDRGVAGFTRRRSDALTGGGAYRRSHRLSDIVVSSFTIACTHFPQVFEVILDQRADTPWPLLRYALGKGPSTVLGIARVHEEDEEAAYPLSLLQRIKAIQHPCPRRGSVRAFVTEQRNKMTDLRRRLADAEDRMMRSTLNAAARATMKRLSVLISKLACNIRDAEEFLFDPETAHVPVYVDARRSPVPVTDDGVVDDTTQSPLPQQRQQPTPLLPSPAPHSSPTPARASAASSSSFATSALLLNPGRPLLLAMVQHYDPRTDTVAEPATSAERKRTANWTISPRGSTVDARSARKQQQQLHQEQHAPTQQLLPRTLTAWLTLTRSVPFEVDEVTSLNILSDSAAQLPVCETWRQVGAHFHAGRSATVVVVQEKKEEGRLRSLRVSLELVHGVLKDTWARRGSSPASSALPSSAPSSRAVMRVAVSVFYLSGSAVADLLRCSTTSRVVTGTSAAGAVVFTPVTLALRPLTGTAVPLNVTRQTVDSLPELETVLRAAVERLRDAQDAVTGDATVEGPAADLLTRRSLTAPGYAVTTVELTQRVVQDGGEDDVYVSSLTVIDLGGHFGLLGDAIATNAALERAARGITASTTTAAAAAAAAGAAGEEKDAPSVAALLLARLLVKRRDLVVCAAALPAVPTAASAYGLMSTLSDFQRHAKGAPHILCSAPPGSVRRFITHLQAVLVEAETQRGVDANSVSEVRDALTRAQSVLVNPHTVTFDSYPCTQNDVTAMMELPAASRLVLDTSALRSSLFTPQNTSSTTPTAADSVSTVGGSGGSAEVSTESAGPQETCTAVSQLSQRDEATHSMDVHASEEPQKAAAAATVVVAPRRASVTTRGLSTAAATTPKASLDSVKGTPAASAKQSSAPTELRSRKAKEERGTDVAYYGVHYRGRDTVLTERDVMRFVAPRGPLFSPTGVGAETRAAAADDQRTEEEVAEQDAEEVEGSTAEPEPVWVPSVLVLNAPTTSSYVKRYATGVRVPLPSSSGAHFTSYASNEVVNIKPTSTGMRSSFLTRAVSCVSRGRTAALLICDTESCDAASCIAWLTLRTVMGGVFQSLKMKEVAGVQHCAALRAFLIEEGRENECADLLAPRLSATQPRHALTRLKYSPFCGPQPADATSRPVKDLQDVNVALRSVLAAARLAHQATAAAEPLRGAIALQLTFHQFIPAAASQPADVVVASLWCVQMGCSAGWMEAIHSSPDSVTGTLLQYWVGGPCYTTSVVGLSRFRGVRVETWKELSSAQQRLREVPLRLPRLGSVQAYMASLQECLRRARRDPPRATTLASAEGAESTEEKTTNPNSATPSTSSSAGSTPKQVEGTNSASRNSSNSATKSADSLMRVTALLKEAQRVVERGPDLGKSSQLPGQLAHEAKTFADLDYGERGDAGQNVSGVAVLATQR